MTQIIIILTRINTTDLNYEKCVKKVENRNLENFVSQEIRINRLTIDLSVS